MRATGAAMPYLPRAAQPAEGRVPHRWLIVGGQVQCAPVDQKRQPGIVRDRAVVSEGVLLHRRRGVQALAEGQVGRQFGRFHAEKLSADYAD